MTLPPNFSTKQFFIHKRLHQGCFEDPSPSSITTLHSCTAVLLAIIHYQEMELSFTRGNKGVVAKHISSDTNQRVHYRTPKAKIDA
jgi:hypothetical protein